MLAAAILGLFGLLLIADEWRERRHNRRLTLLVEKNNRLLIKLAVAILPAAVRVEFYTIIDGVRIRIRDMKLMNIGQVIPVDQVEFFDKDGKAAEAEGLKFGVSDESVAQMVEIDGKPHAKSLGKGSFKIVLAFDGHVGEGEVPGTAESEEIIVRPNDAVSATLKLGEAADEVVPEPVPEPTPEPVPAEPVPAAKRATKR